MIFIYGYGFHLKNDILFRYYRIWKKVHVHFINYFLIIFMSS